MTGPRIADLLARSLIRVVPWGDRVPASIAAELHQAAAWHRISPAVYLYLRDGVDEPTVIDPLEHRYRQQLARHLQTLADLKIAGAALDDARIAWALIKGPALSASWPRPDMREYHDLDLLVDRHRFADTLAALHGSGAELMDRNQPLIAQQLRAELTLRLRHGTKLDLHWDPVNDANLRKDFCFPTNQMLERHESTMIGGSAVPVLDPADALLHIGYHTTLSGAYRLLWLMDIRAASERQTDWRLITRRARSYGVELPLALALDRSRRVLGPSGWPAAEASAGMRFRAWRAAARLADRIRPVPWVPGARGSSRVLYQNVRRSASASVVPTVRDALKRNGPKQSADWQNPLHQDVPDAIAWHRYLSLVQGGHKP